MMDQSIVEPGHPENDEIISNADDSNNDIGNYEVPTMQEYVQDDRDRSIIEGDASVMDFDDVSNNVPQVVATQSVTTYNAITNNDARTYSQLSPKNYKNDPEGQQRPIDIKPLDMKLVMQSTNGSLNQTKKSLEIRTDNLEEHGQLKTARERGIPTPLEDQVAESEVRDND